MKNQAITSIIVAVVTLFSGHAMAGSVGAAQHAAIASGVASGQLTRAETTALVNQQKAISRTITKVTSDGTVTKAETAAVKSAQASANYWIKAYSTNAWTAK